MKLSIMTNVSTLMALAVISLVASIGLASAETVGDGTSEVHVYINNANDFPFNVTVVEGGSVVVHNESQKKFNIEHTGTIGTDRSGTFSGSVYPNGGVAHFNFPVTNCSSCYYAGTYYFKDGISGETGSITIVHLDGWIPLVQEEVGITETVVVVLGNNSTSTTPEPTPIEPELTGKYDVATWTGTYDVVTLQKQLAEVSADLNNAVEKLGHEQNKVKSLEANIRGYVDTTDQLRYASQLEQGLLEENRKIISDLRAELSTQKNEQQRFAKMNDTVTTLESKVVSLEQEKAKIIVERDKWKQLSDNWYAVALEQVRVMVNVLGL